MNLRPFDPDAMTPRRQGWMAAINMGKGTNDNPYGTAPELDAWLGGFLDARMLIQKQTAETINLGRGILLMHRLHPAATVAGLEAIGRRGGEMLGTILLTAAMQVSGAEFDPEDPHATLVVYTAMKARIARKPRTRPHDARYQGLADQAYTLGQFLTKIFRTNQSKTEVECDMDDVKKYLDRLVALDIATNQAICEGTVATIPKG